MQRKNDIDNKFIYENHLDELSNICEIFKHDNSYLLSMEKKYLKYKYSYEASSNPIINREILKNEVFIKLGSKISSLGGEKIYFCSFDGIRFFELAESFHYIDPNEKNIHLYFKLNEKDRDGTCRVIVDADDAYLLLPNAELNKKNATLNYKRLANTDAAKRAMLSQFLSNKDNIVNIPENENLYSLYYIQEQQKYFLITRTEYDFRVYIGNKEGWNEWVVGTAEAMRNGAINICFDEKNDYWCFYNIPGVEAGLILRSDEKSEHPIKLQRCSINTFDLKSIGIHLLREQSWQTLLDKSSISKLEENENDLSDLKLDNLTLVRRENNMSENDLLINLIMAIVSSDVNEVSRLCNENEDGTHLLIEKFTRIIFSYVMEFSDLNTLEFFINKLPIEKLYSFISGQGHYLIWLGARGNRNSNLALLWKKMTNDEMEECHRKSANSSYSFNASLLKIVLNRANELRIQDKSLLEYITSYNANNDILQNEFLINFTTAIYLKNVEKIKELYRKNENGMHLFFENFSKLMVSFVLEIQDANIFEIIINMLSPDQFYNLVSNHGDHWLCLAADGHQKDSLTILWKKIISNEMNEIHNQREPNATESITEIILLKVLQHQSLKKELSSASLQIMINVMKDGATPDALLLINKLYDHLRQRDARKDNALFLNVEVSATSNGLKGSASFQK